MNRIYDILYMVIIMLGISFEIENKYDNYLCKILDGITSSFDNIMVSGEVFDKNGNSLFKKNIYTKDEFESIIKKGDYYIVFLSLAIYDKTSNMSYILDLSCYKKCKPKLYSQVCDSIFVSLYSFNDDVICKAKSNAIKNHFDKIEDATYEKMYFI